MKLLCFTLSLFVVQVCYAQQNNMEVFLTSGQRLRTSWLKLQQNPFFQEPYIIINSRKGQEIKVSQLRSYQGRDQEGNYRKLFTYDLPFPKESSFTELSFREEKTKEGRLFFYKNIFAQKNNTFIITDVRYRFPEETIKKVTYRNVQQTFKKVNLANKKLKKATILHHAQWLSTGIALALLTDFLKNNYNPNDKDFMQKKDEIKLLASGLFFTLPFALQKPKRKKLIEALREL